MQPWWSSSSMGGRIFWSVIPTFLLLFLLLGLISTQRQRSLAQNEFVKRGTLLSENLARAAEWGVLASNDALLASAIRGVTADEDVMYVVVYDRVGESLAWHGRRAGDVSREALELTSAEREVVLATSGPVRREASLGRDAVFDFIAPILTDSTAPTSATPTGATPTARARYIGYVKVGVSPVSLDRQVTTLMQTWVIVSALVLVLSTTSIMYISRQVSRPVLELIDQAEQLSAGRFNHRIPVRRRDEIGQLAEAFNRMAAALQGNIQRREQLLNQVQTLNATLEDRIRARTAELEDRTRALEDAGRHKSEFLANMSHELRTPLNAILGYSEMLQEIAQEDGLDDFTTDLRKIHSSGKHLLSLINNVLDLSKIEAGRMELLLETFEVRTMLEDVEATAQPLAMKNDNQLVFECEPDVGSMHADITRVRQCLFNLLSNACKFTNNGRVTVTVERVTEGADVWIRFRVRDTGIGMSAEQLGHVFEAFRQADASTTRRFGGTGLGLTISREFCRMMGGTITVESETGKGTTFTMSLPAHVSDTDEASSGSLLSVNSGQELPPLPAGVAGGTRVLVIDDDADAREMMARHLARDGCEVAVAAGAKEGLAMARAKCPDVITLDVMMPGMDGWACLKQIKADPTLRDVPVVMVTMLDDRNLGYAMGASDYITKPVSRDQLASALARFRCTTPPCPVLVVEDDTDTRQIFRRMLESQGWAVTEAPDARAGLDAIERAKPELIILDLMLGEMDGFAFLVELRQRPEWRDIPVIVATAKTLTRDDYNRLNGNVEKGSFTRDNLLAEVRRLVSGCAPKGGATRSSRVPGNKPGSGAPASP